MYAEYPFFAPSAFGILILKFGATFTYLPNLNCAPIIAACSSFEIFQLFLE